MEIGDKIYHQRFGKVILLKKDYTTYSIPMLIVKIPSGEKVIRPEAEFLESDFLRNKPVSIYEAQFINSAFLIDTRKKFGKYFDMPNEAEDFRENRGLAPRPKRFEITRKNFERITKRR